MLPAVHPHPSCLESQGPSPLRSPHSLIYSSCSLSLPRRPVRPTSCITFLHASCRSTCFALDLSHVQFFLHLAFLWRSNPRRTVVVPVPRFTPIRSSALTSLPFSGTIVVIACSLPSPRSLGLEHWFTPGVRRIAPLHLNVCCSTSFDTGASFRGNACIRV
jgi:hypothetical protein